MNLNTNLTVDEGNTKSLFSFLHFTNIWENDDAMCKLWFPIHLIGT